MNIALRALLFITLTCVVSLGQTLTRVGELTDTDPGYLIPGENGRAYFVSRSSDLSHSTLWQTNGSIPGTFPIIGGLVSPTDPAYAPFYEESQYTNIFEHNGVVYFTGHDGAHGHELWRTDGTMPGTFLIKDFYYTNNGFFDPVPQCFTVFHGAVYFAANDFDHGWQLWKTDGTISGTERISDEPAPGFQNLVQLQVLNDTLIFSAGTSSLGFEPWKSDGTRAGTAVLKNIAQGANSSNPDFLGTVNGKTIFAINHVPSDSTKMLWVTDGTSTGTYPISQNYLEGGPQTFGFSAKVYKNKLFFSATDSAHGEEVWVSDATPAGTHLFKDMNPGAANSWTSQFTLSGDALYFCTKTEAAVSTLWKTYGTAEGTLPIATVDAQEMNSAGNMIYFQAGLGANDDLWRSDGTAAGTFPIKINPNIGSFPHYLLPLGEQMLFFAYDGGEGWDLWKATPAKSEPSQFANISTRGLIGNGDNILIGGFIVDGSVPKKVIIRALGPSLHNSLPNYLHDPQLKLFNFGGTEFASNDNWREQADAAAVSGTGLAPSDDAEPALVVTLPPGAYTAQVSGVGAQTGIGLVEVYDLAPAADSRAVNISTRGVVIGGDDILIGGFIVRGDSPHRMIIRGLGPSLPVDGRLADSLLDLYDSNGVLLATNDNWRDEQRQEITATGLAPGDDLEAALVITLPPGPYTAQIKGSHGATGIALVEVYQIH